MLENTKNIEIEAILQIFLSLLLLNKKYPTKVNIHQVLGYRKMMTIFESIKNMKYKFVKKAKLFNYLLTSSIFVK